MRHALETLTLTLARTFIGSIFSHTHAEPETRTQRQRETQIHTHTDTTICKPCLVTFIPFDLWTRFCVSANCQQHKKKNNRKQKIHATTTTRRSFLYSAICTKFPAEAKPNAKCISYSQLTPSTKLSMNKHLGLLLLCLLLLGLNSATDAAMQRRQVVQPTWLQRHGPQATPQDVQVRVTSLNLKETALIRANIQQAVNDGTYVVASNPQQVSAAANPYGGRTTVELNCSLTPSL